MAIFQDLAKLAILGILLFLAKMLFLGIWGKWCFLGISQKWRNLGISHSQGKWCFWGNTQNGDFYPPCRNASFQENRTSVYRQNAGFHLFFLFSPVGMYRNPVFWVSRMWKQWVLLQGSGFCYREGDPQSMGTGVSARVQVQIRTRSDLGRVQIRS